MQVFQPDQFVVFYRTDLPDEELLPILESIAMPSKPPVGGGTAGGGSAEAAGGDGPAARLTTSAVDRKLINLQKKLQKIEELKEKKARGDKLEKNQVAGIFLAGTQWRSG